MGFQKLASWKLNWWLRLKFLRTRESQRLTGFIAWVSIAGIALGVFALTTVTSAINGFESEIINIATRMNGDVILYSRSSSMSDPEQIIEKIKSSLPDFRYATPSLMTQLMIAGEEGVSGAILEGVEFESATKVTALSKQIRSGRFPADDSEVMLGKVLAEKLGASIGAQVRLVVPYAGGNGEATGEPKAKTYTVSGFFSVGHYDYDSKYAIVRLSSAQEFLEQKGKVTSFKIKLERSEEALRASDRLNEVFGFPLRAKDWSQLNKNILYAIKVEKAVIAVLLAAIVLVASFNVASALMMFIQEKVKDLSMLQTLGFTPRNVFSLVVGFGIVFGLAGSFLGVLMGLAGNKILSSTKLIQLPADVYFLDHLPVSEKPIEIVFICGFATVVAVMAALFPARVAMKKAPIEGIRYE